jgi:hypothetical protein
MVVWFLRFSLRTEAKMIYIYKAYERVKSIFDLNSFTHELIGPQTNNIWLVTWDQTTSQEVLKFPIIDPKIFWPWLLV